MKRTPLIFAALTPFVAVAGGGDKTKTVDHEELRDDWRVSEIIGSDAHSRDGQNVGKIKDVILTDDGDIASILVEASNLDDAAMRTASDEEPAEDLYTERGAGPATAGAESAGSEREDASGPGDGGGETVAVQWQTPSFNADESVVELDVSANELQRMAAAGTAVSGTSVDMQRRDGQTDIHGSDAAIAAGNARTGTAELDATGTGDVQTGTTAGDTRTRSAEVGLTAGSEARTGAAATVRASDLLGMDVHLANEESYGEIEDVLVSSDGRATAYIVDAGNFFQTEQYALPADGSIDKQEEAVRYEMTSEELESMEEFDLDEHLQGT